MEKTQVINPKLFDEGQYEQHHVAECAEVLLEAEEIQKDPKLMEKIKEHLDKKKNKIDSLQALKDKASEVINQDTEE